MRSSWWAPRSPLSTTRRSRWSSGFTGPAYAVPTPAGALAQSWAARAGGWVLDPVYTAKAFAGLLAWDLATDGDAPVVFWHTGGQPAVFAADHALPDR